MADPNLRSNPTPRPSAIPRPTPRASPITRPSVIASPSPGPSASASPSIQPCPSPRPSASPSTCPNPRPSTSPNPRPNLRKRAFDELVLTSFWSGFGIGVLGGGMVATYSALKFGLSGHQLVSEVGRLTLMTGACCGTVAGTLQGIKWIVTGRGRGRDNRNGVDNDWD